MLWLCHGLDVATGQFLTHVVLRPCCQPLLTVPLHALESVGLAGLSCSEIGAVGAVGGPASAGGLDYMTHRGPFRPRTFCDSVLRHKTGLWVLETCCYLGCISALPRAVRMLSVVLTRASRGSRRCGSTTLSSCAQ